MATPMRYLKSFVAADDDGARHTLKVYASSIDIATTGRPGARMRGLRRIKLDDETVTYRPEGRVQDPHGRAFHLERPRRRVIEALTPHPEHHHGEPGATYHRGGQERQPG